VPEKRSSSHLLGGLLSELRGVAVDEVDAGGSRHRLYDPGNPDLLDHLIDDRTRLELFFDVISRHGGGDVLELGANPYILTYALGRSGCTVVAGGLPSGDSDTENERVWFKAGQATVLDVPLARFNVERDAFPFADGSFDVVVCGELLEHLTVGPAHLLNECNRVLRPGGLLLLSTPNAVSVAQIESLIRGRNPHWAFSPQGIYARHNRLYSFPEVEDLLTGNGFEVIVSRGITRPMRREWYSPGPAGRFKWSLVRGMQRLLQAQPARWRRLAEGVFVTGRKISGPREYRPAWLYGGSDTVPMIAE
jgi:SAM-dependent methyltransferase